MEGSVRTLLLSEHDDVRGAVPTYEVEYTEARNTEQEGTPSRRTAHWIRVRVVRTGEPSLADVLDVVSCLADKIRSAIYTYVRQFPHLQHHRREHIEAEMRGYLNFINFANGTSIRGDLVSVNEITMEKLMEMMERPLVSGVNVDVEDLVWQFVCYPDMIQVVVGGCMTDVVLKLSAKEKRGVWESTLESHTLRTTPVPCAAYALTWCLRRRAYRPSGKKLIWAKEDAMELARKCGWMDPQVTRTELQTGFTTYYPHYRLVLIIGTQLQEPMANDVTIGKEWTYQLDRKLKTDKHTVYVFWSAKHQHYIGIKAITAFFKGRRNSNEWNVCDKCLSVYTGKQHICSTRKKKVYDPNQVPKAKDGILRTRREWNQLCKAHACWAYQQHGTPVPMEEQRCPIFLPDTRNSKRQVRMTADLPADGTYMNLFAYDIESMGVRPEHGRTTFEFETDEDGIQYEVDEKGRVKMQTFIRMHHVPNLVVCKNVYTDEPMQVFRGTMCLEDFLRWMMNENGGRNMLYAHNGSGYDTRLVFEAAVRMYGKEENISGFDGHMRGSKFMQFSIGRDRLIFRDSLLHLPGSLKGLALSYLSDKSKLRKGHFPHLFNIPEHQTYEGPLPAKKFYDMAGTARTQKDISEFISWYDEEVVKWGDRWNFQQELEAYCINDVDVLAEILKVYNANGWNATQGYDETDPEKGLYPLAKMTAPSFGHDYCLRKLSSEMKVRNAEGEWVYLKNMKVKERDALVLEWAPELAQQGWAALLTEEYRFARRALRGGRTDSKVPYYTLTDEEQVAGKRIKYQDIVSMYPYIQIVNLFPIGTPIIYVYHKNMYPCTEHRNVEDACDCSYEEKRRKRNRQLRIVEGVPPPTDADWIERRVDGIVHVLVKIPTTELHPIFAHVQQGKCCFPVGQLDVVCTSVELRFALQHGAKVVQYYRFDKYTMAPSKWEGVMKKAYIEKLVNSKPMPASEEERQRIIDEHETALQMGQAVADSFPRWKKNPAQRAVQKQLANSMWGKHAERPSFPEMWWVNQVDEPEKCDQIYTDLMSSHYEYLNFYEMPNNVVAYKVQPIGKHMDPNTHKGNVVIATFVTAYGRVMLTDQLQKLGKRVLMHDTDSIIYVYDPTPGMYNIPQGGMLGDFEEEDISNENSHGGIIEYLGLAPKSYSLKCKDGHTMMKIKGIRQTVATRAQFGHEEMKELILTSLALHEEEVVEKEFPSVEVASWGFLYQHGYGMETIRYLKKIAFQITQLKGTLDDDCYLIPPKVDMAWKEETGCSRKRKRPEREEEDMEAEEEEVDEMEEYDDDEEE